MLYPAPVILSPASCPIRRDRARKCGHGLREGGQSRLASCSSFSSSSQRPIKIVFSRVYHANTTFSFELGLASLPNIAINRLSSASSSKRAQTACRSLVASSSTFIHRVGSWIQQLPAMASQQILFAETIAGMKKAFKRKSYGTRASLRFSRLGDP